MMRNFHVFGQRCSGTNALIKLIERNFGKPHFSEELGFKHWLVPPDIEVEPGAVVIVITRDAGSWLRSLHRRPWHAHPDLKAMGFAQFIRAPWRSVWDTDFWGVDETDPRLGRPIMEERCPRTGRPFSNALAMRTAKLRNWNALGCRSSFFIKVDHAEIAIDPRAVVDRIAEEAQVSRNDSFTPVDTYKGLPGKPFQPTAHAGLSADDWGFVLRHIDPEIEAIYGHSYD